jgi:Glycosyl hydrolases family 2, sugar binding domain/Glycosyl hydrolases family 2/Glycosyl hydrolases family 2, TIM barrel domain
VKSLIINIVAVLLLAVSGSEAGAIPRPEHPRPDFQRPLWVNLNGEWDFQTDPDNIGKAGQWPLFGLPTPDSITVPFPWESAASGVELADYKGVAWYQRTLQRPASWHHKTIFIVFGAVDYEATIWIDGQRVGSHQGGYTPIRLDITRALADGLPHRLCVRVEDNNGPEQPKGLQGAGFAPCSGIWQTVYLEAAGRNSISELRIQPHPDRKSAGFLINGIVREPTPPDALRVTLYSDEARTNKVVEKTGPIKVVYQYKIATRVDVYIKDSNTWSPESPNLYYAHVELLCDGVVQDSLDTYFGLRKVDRQRIRNNITESFYLNFKPCILRGVRLYGYNPNGLYTYLSDDDIRRDLLAAKEMGFNMVRVYQKIEEPRFYYWADKLGMLVMQDMPAFGIETNASHQNWAIMMETEILRDNIHPSIFNWVLFADSAGLSQLSTEAGQQWVEQQYGRACFLDHLRIIDDNATIYRDHVMTQVGSWRMETSDYQEAHDQVHTVIQKSFPGSNYLFIGFVLEWGSGIWNPGYSGRGDGAVFDYFPSHKFLTNELRLYNRMGGYVYNSLYDAGNWHDGLLDRWRQPKPTGYGDFALSDLHRTDYLAVDFPPCQTMVPGSTVGVPIELALFSRDKNEKASITWQLTGTNRWGDAVSGPSGASSDIEATFYAVRPAVTLALPVPEEAMLARLDMQWLREDGELAARNFINLRVYDKPAPLVESDGAGRVALRWRPADFAVAKWDRYSGNKMNNGEMLTGEGAGSFTYRIRVPEFLKDFKIESAEILLEVKGDLRASANGLPIAQSLSVPKEAIIAGEMLELTFESDDGLTLFGERMGASAAPMSLIMHTNHTTKFADASPVAVDIMQQPEPSMIADWMVYGPLRCGTEEAPWESMPTAVETNLNASEETPLGVVEWFAVKADGIPLPATQGDRSMASVDLHRILLIDDESIAYAMAQVFSPENRRVSLLLGHNGEVEVWCNDDQIYTDCGLMHTAPDEVILEADLKRGWNRILLKLKSHNDACDFSLRLCDDEGRDL